MAARAFIVRPFGIKPFGEEQASVDFDSVERLLIDPALRELGIEGRTTMEIMESGNIRHDMFQRLLIADLVIADLTVHNANVFYELGIRHAFRDRHTYLIYSRIGGEKLPFDIQTDRYLAYNHEKPAESVPALVSGLRRTLASDNTDSPVFTLLPPLRTQDPGRFMVVHRDFRTDLMLAEGREGLLELMAEEVSGLVWEREALRLVAAAQSRVNSLERAVQTWERLLRIDNTDCEAHLEAGSIYSRLGQTRQSDAHLKRVLEDANAELPHRARAHALQGRNFLDGWIEAVMREPKDQRAATALSHPGLEESYNAFRRAFELDLRCFRFGVEALCRLSVLTELATQNLDDWKDMNPPEDTAAFKLSEMRRTLAKLGAAVDLAIGVAERESGAELKIGSRVARAHYNLLTSDRAQRVRMEYVRVATYASAEDLDEMQRFLESFAELGIFPDRVAAAAEEVGKRIQASERKHARPKRAILYRGYGRELLPREANLRAWIKQQLEAEIQAAGTSNVYGIAGAGPGGDILFHEVCQEMGVESHMYAPYPNDAFVAQFVDPGGPEWVERFRKLASRQFSFLQPSTEMPRWLEAPEGQTALHRCNSWMLAVARCASPEITLLAVCDENRNDSEAVLDCVKKARRSGVKVVIADPGALAPGEVAQEAVR